MWYLWTRSVSFPLKIFIRVTTTLRGERWMSIIIVNRFLKRWTTETLSRESVLKIQTCVLFGPLWRQFGRFRVNDLLVALCSHWHFAQAVGSLPLNQLQQTDTQTSTRTPHSSDKTALLFCAKMVWDLLFCDAAGLQSCDLRSRTNTPKSLLRLFALYPPWVIVIG